MPETKDREAVLFRTSPERKEKIRQRAQKSGHTISGWLDDRLGLIFDVDDQLDHDRRRSARRALADPT